MTTLAPPGQNIQPSPNPKDRRLLWAALIVVGIIGLIFIVLIAVGGAYPIIYFLSPRMGEPVGTA